MMQSILSLHFNHQVTIHEKLQPFNSSIRAVNRDHSRKWTVSNKQEMPRIRLTARGKPNQNSFLMRDIFSPSTVHQEYANKTNICPQNVTLKVSQQREKKSTFDHWNKSAQWGRILTLRIWLDRLKFSPEAITEGKHTNQKNPGQVNCWWMQSTKVNVSI